MGNQYLEFFKILFSPQIYVPRGISEKFELINFQASKHKIDSDYAGKIFDWPEKLVGNQCLENLQILVFSQILLSPGIIRIRKILLTLTWLICKILYTRVILTPYYTRTVFSLLENLVENQDLKIVKILVPLLYTVPLIFLKNPRIAAKTFKILYKNAILDRLLCKDSL